MKPFLLATALMCAPFAIVNAQTTTMSSDNVEILVEPYNASASWTLTAEQQAMYDSWPVENRTMYDNWPMERQYYYWQLPDNYRVAYWTWTPDNQMMVYNQVRTNAGRTIILPARIALAPANAMGRNAPQAPSGATYAPPVPTPMDSAPPLCTGGRTDNCMNPSEAPAGYTPGG